MVDGIRHTRTFPDREGAELWLAQCRSEVRQYGTVRKIRLETFVEHWLVGVEPDWPDQAAHWRRAWEADIAPRRPRFDVDEVTPWAIEHALSVTPT